MNEPQSRLILPGRCTEQSDVQSVVWMCIMHEFFPLEFRTGKTQLSHTMCGKLRGSDIHAVYVHHETFTHIRWCSWLLIAVIIVFLSFVTFMKDSQWTKIDIVCSRISCHWCYCEFPLFSYDPASREEWLLGWQSGLRWYWSKLVHGELLWH